MPASLTTWTAPWTTCWAGRTTRQSIADVGAVINRPLEMWAAGRRPRGLCSRRGLVQRDTPPIFFSVLAEKKTGRARSKRKGRFGALRCSGPPRDGGRRIGACSDLAPPSGTLFSSAKSVLPSRGGWCGPRRGGRRIELLLFSLPLAAPRGSLCGGRMWASAPTEQKGDPPHP